MKYLKKFRISSIQPIKSLKTFLKDLGMRFEKTCTAIIALITFASGLLNIFSAFGPSLRRELELLQKTFPLEFLEFSEYATLTLGFALVVLSYNIYKRKIKAFLIAVPSACFSIIYYCFRDFELEQVLIPTVLLVLLIANHKQFTVKSENPSFKVNMLQLGLIVSSALLYGTLGFFYFDKKVFGVDFSLADSFLYTIRDLLFLNMDSLKPTSIYGEWFLNSLSLISFFIVTYVLVIIFRPVRLRQKGEILERLLAKQILDRYGNYSLDYFKLFEDKSFYFSNSQQSFVAFKMESNNFIVLGDPVGPELERQDFINELFAHCQEHDWNLYFFQTEKQNLDCYQQLGFKKLKIGDDAIVDLKKFNLKGAKKKDFRNRIRKLDKLGYRANYYRAPLHDGVVERLAEISKDWLAEGHKERGFSLGYFCEKYLQKSSIMVIEDPKGKIVAFLNEIPSFKKGEVGMDLMRKSHDAPSGVMDYLFVQYIMLMKEMGYETLNFGLAPMSGFQSHEKASLEEQAVHRLFMHLNFLFNYIGLKIFKAKFADNWEPRYLIYKNHSDLPVIALSIKNTLEKVKA